MLIWVITNFNNLLNQKMAKTNLNNFGKFVTNRGPVWFMKYLINSFPGRSFELSCQNFDLGRFNNVLVFKCQFDAFIDFPIQLRTFYHCIKI